MRRLLLLSIVSVIGAACRCTAPDLSTQRFACESSADCVAPHVCFEGECVTPSTTGRDGGEPDSGVDGGVPDAGVSPTCAAAGCSVDATCDEGPPVVCTCKTGFTGDGRTCADVDECATANGGCDVNAVCSHTPGARTCACTNGWTGSGTVCTDIDECLVANGGCDVNAACTNTPGAHTCACSSGFTGNGTACTDVDECLVGNGGCDVNATCLNTSGSRTCTCNTGWMASGLTCVDINECLAANGGCDVNANCTNTPGTRTCACRLGFTGNGLSCTLVVVGDSCGSAVALAFDAGVGMATGSTAGLTDDASAFYPSCAGAAGADAVYTFTTTAAQQLTARVSTTTAAYEPILYVRSVCTGGNEVTCGHAPGPGLPANLFVSSLPAGSYSLFVDGVAGTAGAFQLDVTLGPVSTAVPANDVCAGAIVLPAGPIQFAGTSLNSTDHYGTSTFSSACRNNGNLTQSPAGTPGKDVVYDWTATATRVWTVTMEPIPGWDAAPWVTVAPTCGGNGSSCITGADNAGGNTPGTETFTINATSGTHYFIIIDGYNAGDSGDFTMSIR